MKFLVIFLLVISAISYVYSDSDECTEERAELCIDSLLNSIINDNSEEEVCRELRNSVDCLSDAVDECLTELDDEEEVRKGLQELEKLFEDNCNSDDSDKGISEDEKAEMGKCFEENEDYIFQCIPDGSEEALTALMEKGDVDEDTLKCGLYGLMAICFVERVGEKCGETAANIVDEELSDMPEEIRRACTEVGAIETHAFELLKRRK